MLIFNTDSMGDVQLEDMDYLRGLSLCVWVSNSYVDTQGGMLVMDVTWNNPGIILPIRFGTENLA